MIAATKSGTEKNATVFARYWVEALHDPTADADKNEAISALEAFEYADRKTAAFYESQKRLATEHPVFEDTGKGDPVRAPATENGEGLFLSNFTLVRFGAAQKAAYDPAKRELLAKKEELEQKIDSSSIRKRRWIRTTTRSSSPPRCSSWRASRRIWTSEERLPRALVPSVGLVLAGFGEYGRSDVGCNAG